jgi:hypothetical protein
MQVMTSDAEFDRLVRLTIMESFLAGDRPSVRSVSATLAAPAEQVALAFDRLAEGRAIVIAPETRDLLMAAPFAGTPTDHAVRVAERTHHANCVWDALGIPAMLAAAGQPADAAIETRCPDCAASLHLLVEAGTLTTAEGAIVAHFAVPAARWWADIGFT